MTTFTWLSCRPAVVYSLFSPPHTMDESAIHIRLATISDLKAVQCCAREAYAKYVDRMDREPAPMNADFEHQIAAGKVHAVYRQSSFAGYVVFYSVRDHLHLESVAVAPLFVKQGIGRMLIEYVEQTARERGLKAVELYTNEAMVENLAMYPKLGYIETGRYQQLGFNRVYFRKSV